MFTEFSINTFRVVNLFNDLPKLLDISITIAIADSPGKNLILPCFPTKLFASGRRFY